MADLIYQQGALCDTNSSSNNLSASWTMIIGNDKHGYAQSGYWYVPGLSGCWRHFAQQQRDNRYYAAITVQGACVNPGEHHNTLQKTVAVAAPQYWAIQSNIDSTVFIQSQWSQFAAWPAPFVAEYLGETHLDESDVPGGPLNKTEWGQAWHAMSVQDFNDDTYHDDCGYVTLYPVAARRYSTEAVTCNHTRAWTSG